MINKIKTSFLSKPIALFLASAILMMSFRTTSENEVVLNAGTRISLETVSSIHSELVAVGQILDFKVKYDVVVDGKTVIAAGSIAKGQVTRSQMAKGLGKEGFVEIQIKTVTAADGQEVFLTGGDIYQAGENRQTLSIVLGICVCILFLTMKGKNAVVNPGYEVTPTVATTTTIRI